MESNETEILVLLASNIGFQISTCKMTCKYLSFACRWGLYFIKKKKKDYKRPGSLVFSEKELRIQSKCIEIYRNDPIVEIDWKAGQDILHVSSFG